MNKKPPARCKGLCLFKVSYIAGVLAAGATFVVGELPVFCTVGCPILATKAESFFELPELDPNQ
jgi:hypothetical protein